ncbi:MAG: SMC-Scp complex subunit ScpB [Candidatus Omnitrophica bacterium]|nr:SMC-Scp complex subunit ScpB [Candidatus Omnitrophota bacterium]
MDEKEVKRIIEAILFVSEKPVALTELKDVIEEVDLEVIKQAIYGLKSEYEALNSGLRINEVAGGFRMATEPSLAIWLNKLYRSRYSEKLTKPSLETLSIIAYKQPITRAEIEQIRGVNIEGVLKTLLERNLIRIVGRKEVVGRPILYGTTNQFLEYFGLNSLSELPRLAELGEINQELLETPNQKEAKDESKEPAKAD